jgi:glycosyltransferase involved in cell wall biosynthesis
MRPQNTNRHDGVTIGLSGSTTHYHDWKVLKDVLPQILSNDYGFPVRLMLTGFHPDYFRELPDTDYIDALPYQQYVEMVRASDIVLAPVDPEDAFNYSKSPLKALEGMGATRYISTDVPAGAAVIATDTVTYNTAIKAGKTGLLVKHTPEMWYNAIDSLLRNELLRTQLQLSAHAWVWKHNDISKRWLDWQSAYRQILSKPAHNFISE